MFTVCPKCALTLVVTAADLKVAQGYVRCGRCSNVFNAIAALTDERQVEPPATGFEGYVEPEPPPAEPPAPALAPEEKLEFDPTQTDVAKVFVEASPDDAEATGTFESIVLETGEPDPPEAAQEAAPDPEEALERELHSLAERIEAESHDVVTPAQAGVQSKELLSLDPGLRRDDEVEDEPQRLWPWRLGVAALALLLIAQAIHHYRHDLAANPQLNGALTSIYNALGIALVPRWNVATYEVRQLGATTDAANANVLVVRASVKNGAHQPQPLPLLRVAVQDRFGNRIAARDVAPESYAPRHVAARELLAAGQRIDVELRFLDPGSEAVGFEIDACLLAAGGGVNCANR